MPDLCHWSPCRQYRYRLERTLSFGQGIVTFVMLNPSTADETTNDPTVRRCVGYAEEWGYRHLVVVNLYGWRATDPRALRSVEDPIGPDNDAAILDACRASQRVVAAWGTHGTDRGRIVLAALREIGVQPMALALTRDGTPGHPLYLRADAQPFVLEGGAASCVR